MLALATVCNYNFQKKFGCGRTQIALFKNKESIFALFYSNSQGKRFIQVSHALLSMLKLMKRFILAFSKNRYLGGPKLIEKAKEIAEKLGKPDFKGSRGWLDKWKKRYNVKQLKNQEMFKER